MNLRKLWAAAVIALLPVTLIAQDSGTRLDGSARRLDASPVSASSGGLTNGRVALSNGSTQVTDDAGLTYNKTTDVLTSGAVTAKNLTATGLATPGSITVTPTLTQVGSITTVAGASLVDGDYFTVKYDGGTIPIEFDATPGDGTTGGRIPYVFAPGDTADQIRDGLITLLNAAAPTKLTASSGGAATVAIVLDTPGAVGDTNTENVTDAGFAVTGMANPTAATTYTYKLVARLSDGSTTEAGAASTTAAGHATLSATNYNALSWSAVSGAASYDVYRTVGGATQGKIASATTALSLNDTGLAGGGETAPTVDGTGLVSTDHLRVGTSATAGHVLTMDANGYATPQAATGGISGLTAGTIPKATSATAIGDSGIAESGNSYLFGANKTGTNTAGDNKTFVGNLGTGNAASGTMAFQVGTPQASGTTQHVAATALTLTNTGTGGTAAPQALFADGTAAKPSIAWSTTPNAGIFTAGGGSTVVAVGGSPYISLNYFNSGQIGMPSAGALVFTNSSASALTGSDTYLTRGGAAATLQLGAAASATPVAQTLQAQGSTGTNISGGTLTIQPGAGTGSATGADIQFKTPSPTGSGTGQQTQTLRLQIRDAVTFSTTPQPAAADTYGIGYAGGEWLSLHLKRATLGSKSKALTDGSPVTFATFTIADAAMYSGEIIYNVKAVKGTDLQVLASRVRFSAARVGTNYYVTVNEVGTAATSVSTGTLTCPISISGTGGVISLVATADTSFSSPDSLVGQFRFDSPDSGLTLTFP